MGTILSSGNGFAAVASQSKLTSLELAPKATNNVVKQIAAGELAPPTNAKRTNRVAKAIAKANQAPARIAKQTLAKATNLAQAMAKQYGKQLPKGALLPPSGNGNVGVYRAKGLQGATPAMLQVIVAMHQLGAHSYTTAVTSSAIVAQGQCTPRNARHYNYLGQPMGLTRVLRGAGSLGYVYFLTPAGVKLAAEHAPKGKAKPKAQARKPKAKPATPAPTVEPAQQPATPATT